jgi:signal transduction histidine kinase
VTLQTTRGHRQFQYSVSAVDGTGSDTAPVARAIVLRDVTDRQTREQRLAVLNRVLRHNVRNKLDVVLAHAEIVDDDELQRGIRDNARDLLALSTKAREAEQLMTASMEQPEPVDLAAVATEVVDEFTDEYPERDLTLSAPEKLTLCSHRTVLREVLAELVENALTHTDGASVTVTVRASRQGTAMLRVGDDGPGIPERERRILNDGTETQHEHGQGIGLWFVTWAVTQLGGELSFEENEPTGSVVAVRLYDAEY